MAGERAGDVRSLRLGGLTGRWDAGRAQGRKAGVCGSEWVGGGVGSPSEVSLEPVRTWRCPPRLGAEAPLGVVPPERSEHRAAVLLSFSRSAHT